MSTERELDTLIYWLVSADMCFVIIHILHLFHNYTGIFASSYFSLAADRGMAEMYQYLKESSIVLILIILFRRKSNSVYIAWSLLFGYLLVDDAYRLHEKLGAMLRPYFSFAPMIGLRAQDLGELCVYAFFGLTCLIFIGITHRMSDADARTNSRYFLVILTFFVFFGVVVDMIHAMVKHPTLSDMMALLEDGGEMLVVTIMLYVVFRLVTRKRVSWGCAPAYS